MRDQDEVAQCYLISSLRIYAAVGTFLQRLAPGQSRAKRGVGMPNSADRLLSVRPCRNSIRDDGGVVGRSGKFNPDYQQSERIQRVHAAAHCRLAADCTWRRVQSLDQLKQRTTLPYLTPSIMRYFGCKYAGTVLVQNRLPKKRMHCADESHGQQDPTCLNSSSTWSRAQTRPFSVVVRANIAKISFYRSVVLQPKADSKGVGG